MDKPSALHRRKHLSNLVKATPPFAGLSQELHWLEHCLQEASAGRPHVILIPGQSGIGKTRLLQEVRSDALRRGLQVGYGRSYEDLALPYLPSIEVLHILLDQVPRTDPFTSTQSDQDRTVLIIAGKFSSQNEEPP